MIIIIKIMDITCEWVIVFPVSEVTQMTQIYNEGIFDVVGHKNMKCKTKKRFSYSKYNYLHGSHN